MPLRPSLAARLGGGGGGANSPLLINGHTALNDAAAGGCNGGDEEEEGEEEDAEDSTMTGMAPPPYGPRTKSSMSQVSHASFRSNKSFRDGGGRG